MNRDFIIQYFGYFLTGLFGIGSVSYVIIRYIITKTLEKIEKVELENEDLKLKAALIAQKIGNMEGDISYLKSAWEASNKGIMNLTNTITVFDSNMKIWHKDISVLMIETKQSIDKSNNLVQDATKINTELLGFLRGIGKTV